MYNDPNNAHGGIIDLLLISATGAEGLDLKRVRHVHIMEAYWNYGRILQIIARGVRNGSHSDLPENERDVQPYLYLAVPPIGSESASPTTDEELYADSIEDAVLVREFLSIYDEISVECAANGGACRVCNPTGRALYTGDIARDLASTDPCTNVSEKRVTAKEIEIDGKKYYYATAPGTPFGYAVWVYNERIRAHMPLPQDDPAYMQVITAAESAAESDTVSKSA
jgi:hypothetical protein